MNVDRRSFLASASAICIASLLSPRSAFARLAFQPTGLIGNDFSARLREWFYLHDATAAHQGNLQLIRITDDGSSAHVKQFSLILRSDLLALAMPSGYYQVAGESFCLYVKHSHEFDGRQYYRAEFALLQ